MKDYKKMAEQMRETALTYRGGKLEVSPELWEEIADTLEKKPQGAPILELIYTIATEEQTEIHIYPAAIAGVADMTVKVRKGDIRFAFTWTPNPLQVVTAEEDFFYSLKRAAERLEAEVKEHADG